MNTEVEIALTLIEAWEMREASYETKDTSTAYPVEIREYTRSIADCLMEAGKKNGLSKNMWALLNLAMDWPNDCQYWSKVVLAGKDLLGECNKDAEEQKELDANEVRG